MPSRRHRAIIARSNKVNPAEAPAMLRAAIPHIVHDVRVLLEAAEHLEARLSWISWYMMARNLAVFFGLPGAGRKRYDITCTVYFESGITSVRRWHDLRQLRIESRGSTVEARLESLYRNASQAAALLSWPRVHSPELQPPCREVTEVLLELWADFLQSVPEPYAQLFAEAWSVWPNPPGDQCLTSASSRPARVVHSETA